MAWCYLGWQLGIWMWTGGLHGITDRKIMGMPVVKAECDGGHEEGEVDAFDDMYVCFACSALCCCFVVLLICSFYSIRLFCRLF